MGNYITLKTQDNHEFQAYLSEKKGAIRGCVVIVQEIFGVNQHIKEISAIFADKICKILTIIIEDAKIIP